MNDYIRRAVELADGFHVSKAKSGNTQWYAPSSSAFMTQVGGAVSQQYLDAIAAQLVRQHYKRHPDAIIIYELDVMDTIKWLVDKAIVD